MKARALLSSFSGRITLPEGARFHNINRRYTMVSSKARKASLSKALAIIFSVS